ATSGGPPRSGLRPRATSQEHPKGSSSRGAPLGSGGMRVALVGCGRWGSNVLRDLRSLGCDVTVVARSEQSRARRAEGGAAAIVAAVADLPEVAAVVVATTTSSHGAVLDEVLPLGVPVFVEKPLCPDPVAAARLAAVGDGRLFVMDK